MERIEFDFVFYNTKIYGQYFTPDTINAVVILVHGMGEHSSRYTDFVIPKLLEQNIAVITYDQFGHGKTGGKRGHNPNFDAVLSTVTLITNKATEIFGDLPFFLYGHSMGGNVVINYVLSKPHSFRGVIATSPLLRLAFKPPTWKLSIGKIIQKIAPSITMPSELDVNAISRDPLEVQKYNDDPLVHDKISPNYSLTFFEHGKWALAHAQQLKTPMLLLHGTGDKITDHTASIEFVANSNGMATIQLFENAYHELHNDLEKEQCSTVITNWIHAHIN